MPSYELIHIRDGHERERFIVGPHGLSVGRSPAASIVLADPLVSRNHAEVHVTEDGVYVRDLKSRNGIVVNGTQVEEARLCSGDEFGVGDSTFRLVERTPLSESGLKIPFDDATMLPERLMDGATAKTHYLYRAASLLGSVLDLDRLLQEVLELLFEALPAGRGYILTAQGAQAQPQLRAQLIRPGEKSDLPISRTLTQRVFAEQAAIMTENAQEDARFTATESIVEHAIQSVMCVPLPGRHGLAGVIYIDSGSSHKPFSQEDLELATAIGQIAGVAVENARLYQENVQRARLAAIGEATAGLGHCIKNMLQGVKSGGEFVDEGIARDDLERVKAGWPMLSRATARIEDLVLSLLTISRDRKLEMTPCDLNDTCAEVVVSLTGRGQREGIALRHERGEMRAVACDGREIFRVVMNLVTNAMDACAGRTSAEVVIANYQDGLGAYIEVRDNGCGIPPEILPRLSEAFVSTKGSSGTGLGLACCYKIVKEHGGDIEVETRVGHGTTFRVYLPGGTNSSRK